MAILISPLVLLFDTTLTNPTTTPAISNMLSYAALRGGLKASNGPEKVLEDALLKLIFTVSQTGLVSQEDINAFHVAWNIALPCIPLPPAEDGNGDDMQVDEEPTGGGTQDSTEPNPSASNQPEGTTSSTSNQPDGTTPSTSNGPEGTASSSQKLAGKSSKNSSQGKRNGTYYYPSSQKRSKRRKTRQQTEKAEDQRIQEIPVTKEETTYFMFSDNVDSFPALTAVTSLYPPLDAPANPDAEVDTIEETSKVSGFSAYVTNIADRSVDPPSHRAERHLHYKWRGLSSKEDFLLSPYSRFSNSFIISCLDGPLIMEWQPSLRTLKQYLESSQHVSHQMPPAMEAKKALAMKPSEFQSKVNEGNPVVLVGETESTTFHISTLYRLVTFSSDVQCISEFYSTSLCCTHQAFPRFRYTFSGRRGGGFNNDCKGSCSRNVSLENIPTVDHHCRLTVYSHVPRGREVSWL
jgi:hypothetical protein